MEESIWEKHQKDIYNLSDKLDKNIYSILFQKV